MNSKQFILGLSCLSFTFFSCNEDNITPVNPNQPSQETSFFEENFDGIGGGITQWKLINDNNHVNDWYKGFYDNAWVLNDFSLYNGNADNRMAISCSWFDPAGKADRWLISPDFKVMGDDPYLYWEECTPDPMTKQGYAVRVSPSGGDKKEDFTDEVYLIPQGQSGSVVNKMRGVSLKKYKGKKIRIAFVNNYTKGFLVAIDNIFQSPKKETSIPINLSQKTVLDNGGKVTWMDNDSINTQYEISLISSKKLNPDNGLMFTSNEKTYNFNSLDNGKKYYAYLRAKGVKHWSGPYPIQSAYNIPFSSDLNGNLSDEGWTLVDSKRVATSPIDNSPCVMGQAVADDAAFCEVYTPPLMMPRNQKVEINFDYLTEELDGEISVSLISYDPRDRGVMLDRVEFANGVKKNEKQHYSKQFETPDSNEAYRIIVTLIAYGPKESNNDTFKMYMDNLSVKYVN